jgi:hypothetical protein
VWCRIRCRSCLGCGMVRFVVFYIHQARLLISFFYRVRVVGMSVSPDLRYLYRKCMLTVFVDVVCERPTIIPSGYSIPIVGLVILLCIVCIIR